MALKKSFNGPIYEKKLQAYLGQRRRLKLHSSVSQSVCIFRYSHGKRFVCLLQASATPLPLSPQKQSFFFGCDYILTGYQHQFSLSFVLLSGLDGSTVCIVIKRTLRIVYKLCFTSQWQRLMPLYKVDSHKEWRVFKTVQPYKSQESTSLFHIISRRLSLDVFLGSQ